MPPPLPPLLDGPITTANKFVYVDNLLPSALVTVYSGGVPVGSATSVNPGWMLVPLNTALHHGKQITATQEYTGSNPNIVASGTSGHSNPITVQNPPNPLPTPTFVSGLTTCSSAIFLANLIPGSSVHVTQGGNPLVNGVAASLTTQAFEASANLASGSNLTAWQTIGSNTSQKAPSLIVEAAPRALPAPVVAEPLYACQTAINLSNLVPSANVVISNGVTETSVAAPWSAFELDDMTPLVTGSLTARQNFTRCDQPPSPSVSFNVSTAAPPLPVVSYHPCSDATQLFITNLVEGSILTLQENVPTSPSGSGAQTSEVVPLGSQGVSGKTTTVNLPSSFVPSSPDGPVTILISVQLCGQIAGQTKVTFAAPGGPYGAPTVRAPLYDCASYVVLSGLHPGSEIQIFSGSTSNPRSNPVVATGPEAIVELWTPMVTGESIFARQMGCNSTGNSAPVTVKSIGKLAQPVIATPIRPGATGVQVGNVLPGALVTLLVNGLAIAQATAFSSMLDISTGYVTLANGDQLEAVQSLCTQNSPPGSATVVQGQLKLNVTPNPLIRGQEAEMLVIATDAQTGATLSGLQVIVAAAFSDITPIGPSVSGSTSSSFAYKPASDATVAVVMVLAAPAYIDTDTDIQVTLPPPPPPTIWYDAPKVYGKNFPNTHCTVTGTSGWGFVSTGPFSGDIVTGIPIQTPCDGTPGQYFGIQVTCVGLETPVTLTISC